MKYVGQIGVHTEMCCGSWPQFHDDRGLHGDKNQYFNWDWTINFNKNTKIKSLKIYDDKNKLIYNNSWTFDKFHNVGSNYYPCPKEMPQLEWMTLLPNKHLKCKMETDEVVDALKIKLQVED